MAVARGMLIDGEWTSADEGIDVRDKYTGEVIGTLPTASTADVARATQAAKKAFETYKDYPAHKRAKILNKTAELLQARQEEIATIICR